MSNDADTLRATVSIDLGPDDALERYTEGIDDWWPVETHTVGTERVARVVFEPRLGGKIYEMWDDGTRKTWGEVLLWDPPHRVRYTWHPGRSPETAFEIAAVFDASGSGARLSIEQTGWERLGEDEAEEIRRRYVRGWPIVLEAYRAAEEAPAATAELS